MALSKVKVFYNGQNEEHKHYSFEVCAYANTRHEEYREAIEEIRTWCVENFPGLVENGKSRPLPRFSQTAWSFIFMSETDATAFRLRWC